MHERYVTKHSKKSKIPALFCGMKGGLIALSVTFVFLGFYREIAASDMLAVQLIDKRPFSLQTCHALTDEAKEAMTVDDEELSDPVCKFEEWGVRIGESLFRFVFGFPGGGMRPAGVLMKGEDIYAGLIEGEDYISVECDESNSFIHWFYDYTADGLDYPAWHSDEEDGSL